MSVYSYFLLIKIQCVFLILKRRRCCLRCKIDHTFESIAYRFSCFQVISVSAFVLFAQCSCLYRIEMSIFAFGKFLFTRYTSHTISQQQQKKTTNNENPMGDRRYQFVCHIKDIKSISSLR